MRTQRLLAVLVLAGVITPTIALGDAKPPRPAAGRWTMGDGAGFTVGKSRKKISGLKMPGCAGEIKVIGKQRLTIASRGGYSNWIVGKNTPKTSNGVTPIKIRLHEGDKVVDGTLSIVFAVGGDKRINDGSLFTDACGYLNIAAHH